MSEIPTHQFLVFILVLTRISGLLTTAPVYGTQEVPIRIRAFLGLVLSLMITPVYSSSPLPEIVTPFDLVTYCVGELLIGMALGLGIWITVSGIQLSGHLLSQASGMGIGDVFNPTFEMEIPLFSQFFQLFSLAIFVIIGGHRWLMEGLLRTFAQIPFGGSNISETLIEALTTLMQESIILGFRAAAPVTLALLLATLVLGLVNRTLPQLNIFAIGFGFNGLLTFGGLAVSMGVFAWCFQEQIERVMQLLFEGIGLEL